MGNLKHVSKNWILNCISASTVWKLQRVPELSFSKIHRLWNNSTDSTIISNILGLKCAFRDLKTMIKVKCNIWILLNHASLKRDRDLDGQVLGTDFPGGVGLQPPCVMLIVPTLWCPGLFPPPGHRTLYAAGNSEKWDAVLQTRVAWSSNFPGPPF